MKFNLPGALIFEKKIYPMKLTKSKVFLDNPGQNLPIQVVIISSPCPQFQC